MAGVRLQQMHDRDMYEMIKKDWEDDRRNAHTKRIKKVEANAKYMNENYDEHKPSSFVSYLDANNLYGLAMTNKNCVMIV